MKIEIDDNSVEELKLFIGMIIGKNIRGEDGLVANYCGDEFTSFPFLLEDIYDQLDSANDENWINGWRVRYSTKQSIIPYWRWRNNNSLSRDEEYLQNLKSLYLKVSDRDVPKINRSIEMKFKNFNIKDVLGPDNIKQAKQYILKRVYYAKSLEELDSCIENRKPVDTLFAISKCDKHDPFIIGHGYEHSTNYTYFIPLENVKPKYAQILCCPDDKDIKSWATRDGVKVGDEGYFFNNLWDIMEDKFVKGKIYGISKMSADCFFTDESTSFAFFLPVDKTYMI